VWVQVAARSAAGMPLGAMPPVKRIVGCGDGVIGRGEICDDGGVAPGDGCSALCACEADGDRDGVCDMDDGCPLDPLQDDPGACGCGYDELPTGACPVCPRDEVEGCDGTCEDAALLGDRTCDANLDCATAGFDGGDCHAPRAPARLVGGSGLGGGLLKLYRQDLSPSLDLTPYGANWAGGVRVASGDINGDGRSEIITGAGPGAGPHVKVFDGSSGVQLLSFFAYDATFTGGVHVAAGDVTGDGIDDIVTGAGAGAGPHVKVFDGVTGAALSSFFAFSSGFAGGVTVAAGDITGDGRADIIVGSGPGGAAQVKVFDGATLTEVRSFFPFGTTFTGGVTVASGDVNGDRSDDILVGAGPGLAGAPIVVQGGDGTELGTLVPYVPTFTGGVRVAAGDLNADGRDEVLAGPGDGGEATLSGYDFRTGALTVSVGMAPFGTTTGAWIAAFQP
jgi:cysteine-rich repeat protein